MMYCLRIYSTDGIGKNYIGLGDAEGGRGDVVILFEGADGVREWTLKDANVPLFLSNLLLFLEHVEKHGDAVLTNQFSPNANGRLKGNTLLLSRTSGSDFDTGVYDVCSGAKLQALRRKLKKDIQNYGVIDRRIG